MAGRLIAVWVVSLAAALQLGLGIRRLDGPLAVESAAAGTAFALLAGALAGRGRLRALSAGARDNGSGVGGRARRRGGLAGRRDGRPDYRGRRVRDGRGRVFARLDAARLESSVAVNFDTIDDEGTHLHRRPRRARPIPGAADGGRLAAAGPRSRARRLPLGILVDSLPLSRAGIPAITVGRLTWRTLRLIHTPRDTAEGLDLEDAREVGRALAAN